MNETGRNEGDDSTPGISTISQEAAQGSDPGPTEKPSQAEGDRETIEEDLREKETGS
jgi:hypothetical protein